MCANIEKESLAKRRGPYLQVILIITLGFIVYCNSLNGQFIWDDEFLIKDNRYIKSLFFIKDIFTHHIGAGAYVEHNFYRPLQLISYLFDYSLWGENVVGYHLVNLLLHILTALAVYRLIWGIFSDRRFSFFTSLLFIIHPVHAEAVSYISGRADPLAALFALLCFIFYTKQLTAGSNKTYILMLLSYIAALLSKEYTLILPLLLIAHNYLFRKKIFNKYVFSILGLAFIYLILRLTVLNFEPAVINQASSLAQRVPGCFVAISQYFRLLLLPFDLHMEYGKKIFNFHDPKAITGFILALIFLIYAFLKRKIRKLEAFGIFWFFISILPFLNLYPINAYMWEHWLYFPSIGFFLIAASVFENAYKNERYRIISVVSIISCVIFYSYLTIKQNTYWQKSVPFFERVLKYVPDSARIYNNLCSDYILIGKNREAIGLCNKALELEPANSTVYFNLGNAYSNIGDKQKAIEAYQTALKIKPDYLNAYNNLAAVYSNSAEIDKAIELWDKAVRIDPGFALAHFNLAIFYFSKKQYSLAIKHCDQVIELGYKVDSKFLKQLEPFRDK